MYSIQSISDKLRSVSTNIGNIETIVSDAVTVYSQDLLTLNRDQILFGRDLNGNEFLPSYLNDPYFDTPEEAAKYAAKKEELIGTHNSRIVNKGLFPPKGINTPNLIVTGPFQDHLYIDTNNKSYTIGSSYIDSESINEKYNNNVFGLSEIAKNYFFTYYIRTYLLKNLYETL